MPRNRATTQYYSGPLNDSRMAAVTEDGRGGYQLVFAIPPSHRCMHRGKFRKSAREYQSKGTGRGLLVTSVGVSKEAALAMHAALEEFLFGDQSP